MKKLFSLIFVTLLAISSAHAGGFGVGVFASDTDFDDEAVTKDEKSAGLYIERTRRETENLLVGAELFYANGRGGLGFKFGTDAIPGRLMAGVGIYDDEATKSLDVEGVAIKDTNSAYAPVYYIEYEISGFFVRASRLDSSIDLSAHRQTGTDGSGNPIVATTSETVETEDNWLWAGYRLSF